MIVRSDVQAWSGLDAIAYPAYNMSMEGNDHTDTGADAPLLPGEDAPIDPRTRPTPTGQITEAEALGVNRRLSRLREARGMTLRALAAPDALPAEDAPLVQSAHRLPPRLLMIVRAKAEMEGVTVSQVITDALRAYAQAPIKVPPASADEPAA